MQRRTTISATGILLATALVSLLSTPAARAVKVPTTTHACDPDSAWKEELYDYLTTLNDPVHFEIGTLAFTDPSTLFGDGSNGFATSAQERQVEAIWLMAQFETRPETRMLAIPAIAFT
ncbi:MAG: hypothetical protein AAF657_41875, partial [Acidobacteriota bacterium]